MQTNVEPSAKPYVSFPFQEPELLFVQEHNYINCIGYNGMDYPIHYIIKRYVNRCFFYHFSAVTRLDEYRRTRTVRDN